MPGVPEDMRKKYIRIKKMIAQGYIPTRQEKVFLKAMEEITRVYTMVNK